MQDNYFPKQNEEITLKFEANVSYNANIKKVVINGQEQDEQKPFIENYLAEENINE